MTDSLLHGVRDVLHVVGALTGGENLLADDHGHAERAERDQEDQDDQHEFATGEFDDGVLPVHVAPRGMEEGDRAGVYVSGVTGL